MNQLLKIAMMVTIVLVLVIRIEGMPSKTDQHRVKSSGVKSNDGTIQVNKQSPHSQLEGMDTGESHPDILNADTPGISTNSGGTHGLNTEAESISENKQFESNPFGPCEKHIIGGNKDNHTKSEPLIDDAELAFYPLTEHDSMVVVYIIMGDHDYKASIIGSMITLYECDTQFQTCVQLDVNTGKRPDFIIPQYWNRIRAHIHENEISLDVNNMKTVMTLTNVTMLPSQKNEWYLGIEDDPAHTHIHTDAKTSPEYVAQHACAEYRAALLSTEAPGDHTAVPVYITTSSTTPEEYSVDITLIVGVIIGAVLVIIIAAIVITKCRKRQSSANITQETSPLSKGSVK